MTYTIPPGTPKAVTAAAFGRELVKAVKARGTSIKELERVTGVGHSSIDNYRRGLILPKVEVARALAATLSWPRLAEMIVSARTFVCARAGCGRTFRNDTGAPRRFCSDDCVRIKNKLLSTARANRQVGQSGSWSPSAAVAVRTARSGLRIADERAGLLSDAIAAMCAGCEPEGVCRTADCPLRSFSPLPLEAHREGVPRTISDIRRGSFTPARRAAITAGLTRRWADPAEHATQSERLRQYHAEHPELADKTRAGVAARTPASMSRAAKKAWATRRARAAEAVS